MYQVGFWALNIELWTVEVKPSPWAADIRVLDSVQSHGGKDTGRKGR